MNHKLPYFILILAIVLFSCETDDDRLRDLAPPVIAPAEGQEEIRPFSGEVRGPSTDHAHVRFAVEDPSGIAQIRVDIHSSFDGHTHGRIMTDFEPLNVDDIYSPESSHPNFLIPRGATKVNINGPETDIFWAGPGSRVSGNVLAGPYDFTIQAIDVHGNQTTFADGSNYLATFYIRTPYAPQVVLEDLKDGALEGEPGEPLSVRGTIRKPPHELATDLKFIWIRLTDEEDHHDHDHNHDHAHGRRLTGDYYERMWGSSTWRDGFSGSDLPNGSLIEIEQLLQGENAIQMPSNADHLDLIIWVEDMGGNISRYVYEVHNH